MNRYRYMCIHVYMYILGLPYNEAGMSQMVKNLPVMQEIWVQSLGWEDPLRKEMATHSSILAWEIPWMEEPGGLQSMGSQRVGHDWATSLPCAESMKDACVCYFLYASTSSHDVNAIIPLSRLRTDFREITGHDQGRAERKRQSQGPHPPSVWDFY